MLVADGVGVAVPDGVPVALVVGVDVAVGEDVAVAVGVGEGDSVEVGVDDGVKDPDGEGVGVGDPDDELVGDDDGSAATRTALKQLTSTATSSARQVMDGDRGCAAWARREAIALVMQKFRAQDAKPGDTRLSTSRKIPSWATGCLSHSHGLHLGGMVTGQLVDVMCCRVEHGHSNLPVR